ncbi:MAG: 30S ribosomal protein S2 [Candidatus Kaiserbacteria bacterium GW2011_GWB1_52_6]|uniref:Small ribosomal subunit protein uS2 n=3 Tax=Candidatus Kaiseribacteriota TaxID=1752734 RepID=A0A0G1XL65_9BACT|nr:MAG: 30S ribosomal protein S2 [Candidatus Kaiserbacteria bacterium GW2011_GWA2_52_12]KKW27341.1 MAG: 30S ribosomal protein S2 [Candidatus Kaiserbacteria bacterium GW2011_GWB1_52_6]KKW31595.1 MAG: 30S ribosomal protein S2 [Candidatus Kaiserbacteria bacterium GW2011_GWC2_52_8b]
MIVRVHSGHHRRDVYIVNQRLGHCGEHFILLVSADMNATVDMQTLYDAGAHFALSRARRHPTATPYIFSTKDRTDIFDLEETIKRLESAKALAGAIAGSGKRVLFVGGKNEAISIVKSAAESVGAPYVAGRWIGGSLTNFKNIRKRIDRLEKFMSERESGALEKYTKRERLMIDREIEKLLARFGGLVKMTELPGALFVVDSRHEDTAVKEANQLKIPVIGLSSSDCDFSLVQYPIPGNDTSVRSIRFVAEAIAESYAAGLTHRPTTEGEKVPAIVKSDIKTARR